MSKCEVCGRKIHVYDSGPFKIEEDDGKIKEVCEFCIKDWRKKKIDEMKQTSNVRAGLYYEGTRLIKRGLLWFIIGIIVNTLIFLFVAYSRFPFIFIFWGIVVYSFYDIFRGLYYRIRYKPKGNF